MKYLSINRSGETTVEYKRYKEENRSIFPNLFKLCGIRMCLSEEL